MDMNRGRAKSIHHPNALVEKEIEAIAQERQHPIRAIGAYRQLINEYRARDDEGKVRELTTRIGDSYLLLFKSTLESAKKGTMIETDWLRGQLESARRAYLQAGSKRGIEACDLLFKQVRWMERELADGESPGMLKIASAFKDALRFKFHI